MIHDISKPFPIVFKEAKDIITESVNKAVESGVPCYMVELMISDILHTVQLISQQENIEAWADYQTSLDEANEEAKESEEDIDE